MEAAAMAAEISASTEQMSASTEELTATTQDLVAARRAAGAAGALGGPGCRAHPADRHRAGDRGGRSRAPQRQRRRAGAAPP